MVYEEDGKRKQKTKMLGKMTKAKASQALTEWREECEELWTAPNAQMTVAEYTKRYIDSLETGANVERSTISDYRKSLRKIEDAFSDVSMRDLTSQQIMAWRDSMLRHGLSPVTVKKHLGVLKMVFKQAVAMHDLIWNPCDAVKPPRRPKKTPNNLEPADLRKLLNTLGSSEPSPVITAAYLAVFAGLRPSESCGLRWLDIDFAAKTLQVRRAIGNGAGTYEKEPKSDAGRRLIAMPPQLVEALWRRAQAMRAEWISFREAINVTTSDEEFDELFVLGPVDGRYKNPTTLAREWRSIADANGIRNNKGDLARLYDMRHVYASVLIANGFEDVQVAKLMGHSKPSMTKDVYAAAFEERSRLAAESVGRSIGEAFKTTTRQNGQ